MVLSYEYKPLQEQADDIVKAYTKWHAGISQILLSSNGNNKDLPSQTPPNITEWLNRHKETLGAVSEQVSRLVRLQAQLVTKSGTMIGGLIEKKQPPEEEKLDSFNAVFDEFINTLLHVTKVSMAESFGFDYFTGLRNKSGLEIDYGRELERLTRQGPVFAFALIALNCPKDFKKENKQAYEKVMHFVAEIIQKTLRSYDDAFCIADGRFVLLMKQATKGTCSIVLTRIVTKFENSILNQELPEHNLSLASCVAEPVPGEKLEELLKTLEKELAEYSADEGGVLEHKEISPLEQYAQSLQKQK